MDPTNILYPRNRFAAEEEARRVEPAVRDIYAEMELGELIDASQSRPDEPAAAAERLAEALLPNLVEAHALLTAAERFTRRSVKAVQRPIKVYDSLEWITAWGGEFVELHARCRDLTTAHTTMAHAARTWRVTPGLGDEDRHLATALNGMARWLEEVKALLDTAGRSRIGPEETAA